MTSKNLTTDQKVDLVLERLASLDSKVSNLDSKVSNLDSKVSNLDSKVSNLDSKVSLIDKKVTTLTNNQNDLIKTVSEMALIVGKTADQLEAHIKQTDHSEESRSFSPFKSGAFVA